jgi:hypothetical protein
VTRDEGRQLAHHTMLGRRPLAAGPRRDLHDRWVRIVQQPEQADIAGHRIVAQRCVAEGYHDFDAALADRRISIGQSGDEVSCGEAAGASKGTEGRCPYRGVSVGQQRTSRRTVARVAGQRSLTLSGDVVS